MVFLKRNTAAPARKRPPPPSTAEEEPHSTRSRPSTLAPAPSSSACTPISSTKPREAHGDREGKEHRTAFVVAIADAGCTLSGPAPPSLPADPHKFRRRLESRLSSDSAFLSQFLSGFSLYIQDPNDFRRILVPATRNGTGAVRGESLTRMLLLVPQIQPHLQTLLLEKLPEHFDGFQERADGPTGSLDDDVARLIINQFRWLDFIVDPETFSGKLMEVLSICPLALKKEIVGSLPEIIGERSSGELVEALDQLLRDDLEIVVPVLDSLSNLNLDEQLQEKAVSIALSCLRTIDANHVPHLIRFLLLSATPRNIGKIIKQIREQIQLVSVSDPIRGMDKKLKGKTVHSSSSEASILEALHSSLRFKNIICEAILKELVGLNQPRDHKAIDVWLLMFICTNGCSLQKNAERVLKKKILDGLIEETLFDQCIYGQRDLVKEYFAAYLSMCEYLVGCKEKLARDFGIHTYVLLFQELNDTYSRQEVVGALVAHIGSGLVHEIASALETMNLLASNHSQDLVPVSSHINGILDYLEEFNDDHLHKVYEIFCKLSLCVRNNNDYSISSLFNEILMIVQKQVGNPNIRYRRMGIIGTLKIVSTLGDANGAKKSSSPQKSSGEEALELLKMSMESCKSTPQALILLYDELIALLETTTLHLPILEWLAKHSAEFESVFLADLNGGCLLPRDLCNDLEGELWMNLDGELSPICLDILQLLSPYDHNSPPTLQLLPVQFLLLSTVERSMNQGSLGGIDALLGCPLYLPSPKYFDKPTWSILSETQRKVALLSLYFTVNWIRELLNAFSTQVSVKVDSCMTQASKEETISKLLKRLRNLIYLESLLSSAMQLFPASFPELHSYMELSGASMPSKVSNIQPSGNSSVGATVSENSFRTRKSSKRILKSRKLPSSDGKMRQPTIAEVFKKAGATPSQELPTEGLECSSSRVPSESNETKTPVCEEHSYYDICSVPSFIQEQRYKFRPLRLECLSILSFSQGEDSCCSDSAAELPLYLYLLRDLHHKLELLSSSSRLLTTSPATSTPPGLNRISTLLFLEKLCPLFPSLRKHLTTAICALNGETTCSQDHWKSQSSSAGNIDIKHMGFSNTSAANYVSLEILCCFRKLLNIPELYTNKGAPMFKRLLETFQPNKESGLLCLGVQPLPSSGNIDHLYCGTYVFLEDVMDIAYSSSFSLASELLVTLESLVNSIPIYLKLLEGNGKGSFLAFSQGVYPFLQKKLGKAAHKLLCYNWNNDEQILKNKGEKIQKILHIYLNNMSDYITLVHLACEVLPQVPSRKTRGTPHIPCDYSTLFPAIFDSWYKVLHEENLAKLNKLIKDNILVQPRKNSDCESIKEVLMNLRHFVDVDVSLVNICKTRQEVGLHSMAVRYGGKFIDTFLKVFDFLEAHFVMHNDLVIQMVKELQKATRVIQTLCSEAKGSKRTMITSKIPATKRSLERFLFRVKALLHRTSNGPIFWLGNLKHKDLLGRVVSSQVYVEEDDVEEPQTSAEDDPNAVVEPAVDY